MREHRENKVVQLADGTWLYLQPTTTYCRNCDGGGGCMDCVGRYIHNECVVDCPVCNGSLEVSTYEVAPWTLDEDQLETNRVERVHF